MLLVFMYHRVWQPELPHAVALFTQHLRTLAQRYPIVVPGEPLPKNRLAVCLTFDDAYFDFYHVVYPLLRALKIRAVLAVPVKFIIEQTALAPNIRLNVPHAQMMTEGVYQTQAPFCTWQEMREMTASGQVVIASHGYQHLNLTQPHDFHQEVVQSQQVLAAQTGQSISTFVYPFGKMQRALQHQVMQHYTYAMRIGSALNRAWHNGSSKFIYRIDAEPFWQDQISWSKRHYWQYRLRYLSNVLRAR